jgi:hypothetical protein
VFVIKGEFSGMKLENRLQLGVIMWFFVCGSEFRAHWHDWDSIEIIWDSNPGPLDFKSPILLLEPLRSALYVQSWS